MDLAITDLRLRWLTFSLLCFNLFLRGTKSDSPHSLHLRDYGWWSSGKPLSLVFCCGNLYSYDPYSEDGEWWESSNSQRKISLPCFSAYKIRLGFCEYCWVWYPQSSRLLEICIDTLCNWWHSLLEINGELLLKYLELCCETLDIESWCWEFHFSFWFDWWV